jgi:AraC-like DNA-binding protein
MREAPLPEVVYVGSVGLDTPERNWSYPLHQHTTHHQLILVLAGRLEVRMPERALTVGAGQAVWYPMNVPHQEKGGDTEPFQSIYVSFRRFRAFDAGNLPLVADDRHGRMETLMRWMHDLSPSTSEADWTTIAALMRGVLHEYIARATEVENDVGIERVRRHVRKHLSDRMSLRDLASIAGLSPYHFIRRFTRVVGVTPGRFVRAARVEAARVLLRRTDLPLREIAARTGFPDEYELSRVFKRVTGATPTTVRTGLSPARSASAVGVRVPDASGEFATVVGDLGPDPRPPAPGDVEQASSKLAPVGSAARSNGRGQAAARRGLDTTVALGASGRPRSARKRRKHEHVS